MKKGIKIILIVIGIVIGIVLLDTIQALAFNNDPIFGIESKCKHRSGILVDTYHCGNGESITKFKFSNYSLDSVCPGDKTCY